MQLDLVPHKCEIGVVPREGEVELHRAGVGDPSLLEPARGAEEVARERDKRAEKHGPRQCDGCDKRNAGTTQ